MAGTDINREASRPIQEIYRRFKVKRRDGLTGTFEADWQDLSSDVIRWGNVVNKVDQERIGKFRFGGMQLQVSNISGRFNPYDDQNSFWFGYGDLHRSLVKIEAGFRSDTLGSNGIWTNYELPDETLWDDSTWDVSEWDGHGILFAGIIWGEIPATGSQNVTVQVKPLTQVFHDYAAENIAGYTSSLTASRFMELVRDQTDGSGNFVFRPFFGDTTGNWDIATTTSVYAHLSTSTADSIVGKTVWQVMEQLAEAENYVVYSSKAGTFRFVPRDANTSTVAFEFHGAGSFDTDYKNTIKQINSYSWRLDKYYSRVKIKFADADTSTSYVTVQSTLNVGASNVPWNYGEKTLSFENLWIPTSTVANTLATAIFNEVSALKKELSFTATFVPHLDVLDRISVNYDSSEYSEEWLWDANNWADDTLGNDLIWDNSKGHSIQIANQEFKILEYDLNLDNLETRIVAREV